MCCDCLSDQSISFMPKYDLLSFKMIPFSLQHSKTIFEIVEMIFMVCSPNYEVVVDVKDTF